MELWFAYAIGSVFFGGIQAVVQKVVVERKMSTTLVNSYAAIFSGLIALTIFILSGETTNVGYVGVFLVFLCGASYMYGTIARAHSMRHLDTSTVFTSYKTLTLVGTVAAGVIFFSETMSIYAWLGVLAALSVPLLLTEQPFKLHWSKLSSEGVPYILFAVLMGTLSMVLTKFTLGFVDSLVLFTAGNHLFAGIAGMIQKVYKERGDWHKEFLDFRHPHSHLALAVFVEGAAMSAGFFALLMAFQYGPLGLVYTINSAYIMIPILFAMWYYKEKMTFRKLAAIFMSVGSLVLIK